MRSRVNLIQLVPSGQHTLLHNAPTFSVKRNENLGGSTFIATGAAGSSFTTCMSKGLDVLELNTFMVHCLHSKIDIKIYIVICSFKSLDKLTSVHHPCGEAQIIGENDCAFYMVTIH